MSRRASTAISVRAGLNYRFDWSQPEPSASGATPLLASPRLALMPAPTLGDWRLSFAPYSWALGINGSVTALGETVGADLSFIDFLTKTSAFPLNFAGRGGSEQRTLRRLRRSHLDAAPSRRLDPSNCARPLRMSAWRRVPTAISS